jgi:hypothetical protein
MRLAQDEHQGVSVPCVGRRDPAFRDYLRRYTSCDPLFSWLRRSHATRRAPVLLTDWLSTTTAVGAARGLPPCARHQKHADDLGPQSAVAPSVAGSSPS